MMRYTVRPLSDRTWLKSTPRRPSRFKATWTDTLDILDREISFLKGRDVVIECDVTEGDLRLDGTLRANARPSSPAVVVAFESVHGPLLYRCDRHTVEQARQGPAWQHNVRAIALTLEALRAVDRYGATETGQQYTGFKALPAGRSMPASHMTPQEALSVVYDLTGIRLEGDPMAEVVKQAYRRARAAAHPDRHGGDQTLWDQVEEAARVLGVSA